MEFVGTNPLRGELTAEDFEWLSKEHIFVLVYLVITPLPLYCVFNPFIQVSSMHASSCGSVEKAILYAEKALQITSQQPDGTTLCPWATGCCLTCPSLQVPVSTYKCSTC